jgi:hypothetical protein
MIEAFILALVFVLVAIPIGVAINHRAPPARIVISNVPTDAELRALLDETKVESEKAATMVQAMEIAPQVIRGAG